MSTAPEGVASAGWPSAVRLIARWLDRHERIDALLDTLPGSLAGAERARAQNLILGVVRNFGRIEQATGRLVPHPPRFLTRAVLFVAGYELIEAAGSPAGEGRAAKIVHHAVEQTKSIASPAEARLVNAVVRKLAAALASNPPNPEATAEQLGEYFSHPAWLVRNWLAQFGPENTRALLEWNQQPPRMYARWRQAAEPVPAFLKPTAWAGFFEVAPGHWSDVEPLLKAGKLYLQDPATRLPVELLDPKPGESVLDLCAAPGGKSLLIADRMQSGQLVAVDVPDARIDRLKENLSRAPALNVALVQGDVRADIVPVLREHQLPASYAAVLIDVPCSNTGVMRHRVDVKWRLQAGDFKKHPRQQLSLLHAAARLVAPGGRLVYSTCSIDSEENEQVVGEFFASRAGSAFKRETSVVSHPWVTGHDGGAAFLLRRNP
ncbi:MAG: RNA methyltransferase [Opitutus sp.]|nr:RNA methyltransferase [Opitutus sp.]